MDIAVNYQTVGAHNMDALWGCKTHLGAIGSKIPAAMGDQPKKLIVDGWLVANEPSIVWQFMVVTQPPVVEFI